MKSIAGPQSLRVRVRVGVRCKNASMSELACHPLHSNRVEDASTVADVNFVHGTVLEHSLRIT